MADFPNDIFEARETENLPGLIYDPADKKNFFSEDFQNLGAEITAIEETLGTNPEGIYGTVKEWLQWLTDNMGGAAVWGGITGTLSDQLDLQSALDAKQNSLGYTPENAANKENTTIDTSTTKYPTVNLLKTGLDAKQNSLGYTAEDVSNKQSDLTASTTKYPTVNAVNTGLATKQNSLGFTAEDVSNKKTTMSGNTTSNTFYLSAKAVYDFCVATFQAALGYTPEDVANKSTNTSLGTSDTLYPSQKAVKTYVDAHAGSPTYKSGVATRGMTDSSGDQVIAHGLGKTPLRVRITANLYDGDAANGGAYLIASGVKDSSGVRSIHGSLTLGGNGGGNSNSTSLMLDLNSGYDGAGQQCTIAWDATNFTLSWTKTGSPHSHDIQLLWEAEA